MNALCPDNVNYKMCTGACHADGLTTGDPEANRKCSGKCMEMFKFSHDSDCLIWDFECCCGPLALRSRYQMINGGSYHNKYDTGMRNNNGNPQTTGEKLPDEDEESESYSDSGYESSPTPSDIEDYNTDSNSDASIQTQGFVFPNPNMDYRSSEENLNADRYETSSNDADIDTNGSDDMNNDSDDHWSDTSSNNLP